MAAPDTLLPRVMTAVRALTARPWYQRAWFTWPLGLQAASLAVLALVVGGGVLAMPWVEAAVSSRLAGAGSEALTKVPDLADRVAATSSAVEVLWRVLLHPILLYGCAIVALMSAACVAVAFALNRVVFGRTAQI